MKFIYLFIVSALLVSHILTASNLNDYLLKSENLYLEKKFIEGKELLSEAISIFPQEKELKLQFGLFCMALGEFKLAKESIVEGFNVDKIKASKRLFYIALETNDNDLSLSLIPILMTNRNVDVDFIFYLILFGVKNEITSPFYYSSLLEDINPEVYMSNQNIANAVHRNRKLFSNLSNLDSILKLYPIKNSDISSLNKDDTGGFSSMLQESMSVNSSGSTEKSLGLTVSDDSNHLKIGSKKDGLKNILDFEGNNIYGNLESSKGKVELVVNLKNSNKSLGYQILINSDGLSLIAKKSKLLNFSLEDLSDGNAKKIAITKNLSLGVSDIEITNEYLSGKLAISYKILDRSDVFKFDFKIHR